MRAAVDIAKRALGMPSRAKSAAKRVADPIFGSAQGPAVEAPAAPAGASSVRPAPRVHCTNCQKPDAKPCASCGGGVSMRLIRGNGRPSFVSFLAGDKAKDGSEPIRRRPLASLDAADVEKPSASTFQPVVMSAAQPESNAAPPDAAQPEPSPAEKGGPVLTTPEAAARAQGQDEESGGGVAWMVGAAILGSLVALGAWALSKVK